LLTCWTPRRSAAALKEAEEAMAALVGRETIPTAVAIEARASPRAGSSRTMTTTAVAAEHAFRKGC